MLNERKSGASLDKTMNRKTEFQNKNNTTVEMIWCRHEMKKKKNSPKERKTVQVNIITRNSTQARIMRR